MRRVDLSAAIRLLGALIAASAFSGCSSVLATEPLSREQLQTPKSITPIVIAHRGASGYLPEHTLEAAVLAYSQNADYIEQDLVVTRDNVLIVLHDIHLERTTDVEQKFPQRVRNDGRFYAIDFTLDEIKTLIVHERHTADGKPVYPNRYNGTAPFRIATFEEHIVLIQQLNKLHNKQIGIYPEIKSPAWHMAEGKDISTLTLAVLKKYKLTSAEAKVYLQCFDFNELKRLRNELNAEVKLIQLLAENDWQESDNDYDYLRSEKGLAEIAEVAVGIGPWFGHLVSAESGAVLPLTNQAKNLGLKIHPYTFRVDQLPTNMTTEQTLELLFDRLSVDGVFSDQTDVVKAYLDPN